MATIKILDHYVDVDVRAEIEEFEWENVRWSEGKMMASSPFRDDRSPSFYIDFEGEYAGVFGDSAYEDEYYKSGNLPKLLSFLRNETYEESCYYLLDKYGVDYDNDDVIELVTPFIEETAEDVRPTESMDDIELDTEYLPSRGIHPKVVELQNVFSKGNAIGIPWYDLNGQLAAIKFRSKKGKDFWYAKGSKPISELVYGLDTVVQKGIEVAVICEAEIDAMTWQSAGRYAIAVGGSSFNEVQADQILSSGLSKVVVVGDNDSQGRKFNSKVERLLSGKVELYKIDYSQFNGKKDANDLGVTALRNIRMTHVQTPIKI